MREAKALASLRICADWPEPSLLADAISTEISRTRPYVEHVVKNIIYYPLNAFHLQAFLFANESILSVYLTSKLFLISLVAFIQSCRLSFADCVLYSASILYGLSNERLSIHNMLHQKKKVSPFSLCQFFYTPVCPVHSSVCLMLYQPNCLKSCPFIEVLRPHQQYFGDGVSHPIVFLPE